MGNPSEFLQEGSNRAEVASAKDSLGRFKRSSQSQRLEGVAEGYPDVVEHARIPVAIDHTLGATVPYSLGAIELIDGTHGPFPVVAPPEIEVPIEIEILIPS